MDKETIKRLFPNASASLIQANLQDYGQTHPDNPRTTAELERAAGDEPLAQGKGEKADTGRVHIRFISVRKRLCDPDNLSEKALLDCLRYCGAIDGDEPEKIILETTQRRAEKEEKEHTIIEITYP